MLTLEGIGGVEVNGCLVVDGQDWDIVRGDVGVDRHRNVVGLDIVGVGGEVARPVIERNVISGRPCAMWEKAWYVRAMSAK